MCAFVCLSIPKYNKLSLYSVTCMVVFAKDEHLELDNQVVSLRLFFSPFIGWFCYLTILYM